MNIKKYVIASIAAFMTFQLFDFITHGIILSKAYEELSNVWRPDMMSNMWIIYTTSFVMSFIFTYIFTRSYKGKGIVEGVQHGVTIGLLLNVVGMFNQYAIYPIPFSLAIQWFIYNMISFTVAGIVVSLIYNPKVAHKFLL